MRKGGMVNAALAIYLTIVVLPAQDSFALKMNSLAVSQDDQPDHRSDFEDIPEKDILILVSLFYAEKHDDAWRGVDGLAAIGKPAIPYLIQKLHVKEPDYVKGYASRTLGKIGEDAVPSLISILKNEQYNQAYAIGAIGDIGLNAGDAVPYLIDALEDERTRYVATQSLGYIGPNAKDAVPALLRALNDPERRFRVFSRKGIVLD